MGLKYGSVCSGIEAATVAWHDFGWQPAWFSEIEAFPKAVLAHRYPAVPDLGDMTKLHERKEFHERPIDVLVGGTPCQSFSVAGLRKGMADPRGNLALHFLKILDAKRPKWVVWENVPGVLSSTTYEPIDGNQFVRSGMETSDFGTFLAGLRECGYGFAYRVLDAQYFGVPQRRRRVFVVGYLGDWRPASAVLFERQSLSGNPAPSRQKGQGFAADIAPSIGASGRGFERAGETRGQDPVVAYGGNNTTGPIETATAINAKVGSGRMDFESETLILDDQGGDRMNVLTDGKVGAMRAHQHQHQPIVFKAVQGSKAGSVAASETTAPTLGSADSGTNRTPTVAFKIRQGCEGGGKGYLGQEEKAFTVATHQDQDLFHNQQVRRLTPRECERLQGFPDDYTLIPYRGKSAADGTRYKALGNSMAVPVMRWIGKRIKMVDKLIKG